ncbi:uncharacterized protein LOC130732496 [Lotus japonicus]|uniref:uncharacterized protein LOC130732496 n=1 Tax=Lotus japonicus TaxID=34305 RepID=UPI00258D4786|nr:uncharacterized protein LOC130732496 [Lotus japonicus]
MDVSILKTKQLSFEFYYDDDERKFKPLLKLVRADIGVTMGMIKLSYFNEFLCKFADIPIFPNLIHMKLTLGGRIKMESLLYFLNHCPRLQNLVMENLFCIDSRNWPNTLVASECFSSQLRTCFLPRFTGTDSELRFSKFVMQNSTLLGSMKIIGPYLSHEKKAKMRIELDSCPRSSANCELLFM